MNGGTISENTSDDYGGGVRVRGTFTMTNGTIHKNISKNAGGVGIGDDTNGTGTFTMNGGTISGNTATSGDGGGVRVYKAGTFTKTAGIIYGNNETNNSLQNKATNGNGQAVYAQSGNTTKSRNMTAGPGNSLYFSPSNFTGDWD
jgi:hypothetical protein